MTSKERQLKKQLRKQRLLIMAKQEDIDERYCQVCTNKGDTNAKCRGCEIHTQLNQLGEQLTAIANSKPRKEKNTPIVKEEKQLTKEISLVKYTELKAEGRTEKDIAETLGVSTATLWNWKKKQGVLPVQSKEPVLKVKDKPHEVAKDKLKNKITVLTNELQELELINNEITRENKELKLKSDTQEAHLESFTNTNRGLERENESLKGEIAKIKDLLDQAYTPHPQDGQLDRLKLMNRLLMQEVLEVQQ